MIFTTPDFKRAALASLMIMTAATTFTACSNDTDDEVTNNATEIRLRSAVVEGSVADWTRTRAENQIYLESGKTINVTINRQDDDTQLYQQELTAGSNGVMSGKTSMYFPIDGTNVNIYAYVGGNFSITEVEAGDKKTTPVKDDVVINLSTNKDQSTTDKTEASDFLYGENLNVERTSDHVSVQMAHMFSRVILKVTANSTINSANTSLNNIEISDVINSATYTIGQNAVVASTKSTDKGALTVFSTTTAKAITDQFSQNDTVVVIPQAMAGKVITFGTTNKNYTVALPSGTEFKPGKSYTFNITLSAASINLEVTIKDWDAVTAVDLEAGYDIPAKNNGNDEQKEETDDDSKTAGSEATPEVK
jgi:hypothetical protein